MGSGCGEDMTPNWPSSGLSYLRKYGVLILASRVYDHEVIHLAIVFELLLEGVFDGGIVGIDKLVFHELNRQTGFA